MVLRSSRGTTPAPGMSKCNMCIDRLDSGLKPICVLSCSMRALEFPVPCTNWYKNTAVCGAWKTCRRKTTQPSVVFKPPDPKRRIVKLEPPSGSGVVAEENSRERRDSP